ncbi:Ldh family oxidoreductase [Ostreiculturibacter nitratireducens]|uniref:Ldh family oxidoreductase n=1 Tax=Ostreiculturibacter nitratireducens TaxID=3075226 RepID=UPI0031B621D9
MPKVAVSDIEETSAQALRAHGAAPWIAAEVARAVAKAEALGNVICGLYYLESYCLQLRSGRVRGDVEPVVERPRPGFVRVDANFGFAQPAFTRGLPLALEAARECGTACLAVGHAHTCTSLGYFTEQIAQAGLIGMGFTNASAIVAPPGGKSRILGTNPFAFSAPDGAGGLAMQFDFSTAAVALGKITMAKAAGRSIPPGWAVDAEGNTTTDPEEALKGALVSAAGYKGWGLGLMVEILAAGMTGGVNSLDVKPLKAPEGTPHDLGQFYILIDPALSPAFAERLSRLAEAIAADEGARMPGANRVPAEEVEVPDALWQLTTDLAGA